MNDDDLRRALGAYATAAPAGSAGIGPRVRRARRRRVRTALACGAAAVAVVGVTGVLALDRPGSSGLVPAHDPATTTSPTTAPVPAPTSATERGPYGLVLRLTVSRAEVLAGDPVTLDVTADDTDGTPSLRLVDWGDGVRRDLGDIAPSGCPSPYRAVQRPAPGWLQQPPLRHTYRTPGRHVVTVRVGSDTQCVANAPAPEYVTARVATNVLPGAVATNGRAAPEASEFEPFSDTTNGGGVVIHTVITDVDGWVGSATVDWGDGARETKPADAKCEDGRGRYFPRDSYLVVDGFHEYARPGTYTITVTFTSTGCGGRDTQRGKKTGRVTVQP